MENISIVTVGSWQNHIYTSQTTDWIQAEFSSVPVFYMRNLQHGLPKAIELLL